MQGTFSFSHYTKTKVTGLTHNMARTIITVHRHPCIKFLSSQILEPPSQLTLHSQPAAGWSALGCSSADIRASDHFPKATCFHKNRHFWFFLCSLTIWTTAFQPACHGGRSGVKRWHSKCKDGYCKAFWRCAIWLVRKCKVLFSA